MATFEQLVHPGLAAGLRELKIVAPNSVSLEANRPFHLSVSFLVRISEYLDFKLFGFGPVAKSPDLFWPSHSGSEIVRQGSEK